MINNKSVLNSRQNPEKTSQSNVHSIFLDRNDEKTQSSKAFKRLSISLYNWAIKNTEKQIVCKNFNPLYH
jgi:hypothetical protein